MTRTVTFLLDFLDSLSLSLLLLLQSFERLLDSYDIISCFLYAFEGLLPQGSQLLLQGLKIIGRRYSVGGILEERGPNRWREGIGRHTGRHVGN